MIVARHAESEWNRHYAATRIDPGLRDPGLSVRGREQAVRLAETLAAEGVTRLIASPFRRTLETASVVALALSVPLAVEPLIRERCVFSCDIGTPPDQLQTLWPTLDFGHLDPDWWGVPAESEQAVWERAQAFRTTTETLPDRATVAVISHWAFIRALTGIELDNATFVRLA